MGGNYVYVRKFFGYIMSTLGSIFEQIKVEQKHPYGLSYAS
jgi:hypothetical protein